MRQIRSANDKVTAHHSGGCRYPAITLNGQVFVATVPGNHREPVRHLDALTRGIRILAGTNASKMVVEQLIKQIDMGKIKFIYGTALEDGTNFIED